MDGQPRILDRLHDRRGSRPESLDQWFAAQGDRGWDPFYRLAREAPALLDEATLDLLDSQAVEHPGALTALLISLAATDSGRRAALSERCRAHLRRHPVNALAVAGNRLHEFHRVLDPEWIAIAREAYDHRPEGAWGILRAAALYETDLIGLDLLPWLRAHREGAPEAFAIVLLSLALAHPAERKTLVAEVVAAVADHPAATLAGAALCAKDEAALLGAGLLEVAVARVAPDEAAEVRAPAWDLLAGAAQAVPQAFDEARLDALTAAAQTDPGTCFTTLRRLIDARPGDLVPLRRRFVALIPHHPKAGIEAVYYGFQGDDVHLVDRDMLAAVCAAFPAAAYNAYDFLCRLLRLRPALLDAAVVAAALANIDHATNYAFGFFRDVIEQRPEFTPQATLALFECLSREPIHRAHIRTEQMQVLSAIAEASQVRTGLEEALRAPPQHGSRRARALLAIMFRDRSRARRHVLREALRWAATTVLTRRDGDGTERFEPIWSLLWFIVDQGGDDRARADAERFLEAAFQLSHLFATGAQARDFFERLDLEGVPPEPLPGDLAGLVIDPDLLSLHGLACALGRRFDDRPKLGLLDEVAARAEIARAEAAVLAQRLDEVEAERRSMLVRRLEALRERITIWEDPLYRRACRGETIDLPPAARNLLRQERKDLAKRLRSSLRAEAVRIAIAAVERTRQACYRARVAEVLGREVDLDGVDPGILPVFLWFPVIAGFPANTRWLTRLVEDRLLGRPSDWLRDEAAPSAWAAEVRAAQPGVHIDRWRAEFSREYAYRPADARTEKRRRIATDLAQARSLLEGAGVSGFADGSFEEITRIHAELSAPSRAEDDDDEPAPRVPTEILADVAMNLERVRLALATPDSDFTGRILLRVETDPIQMLFMGEYGFASCLSLRGINAWSAVSNAIDIDKCIVWACEPNGNVVGRRLLALIPEGILTFRTYTNRHGLALGSLFERFIAEYAEHCGVPLARSGNSGPLLSDRWYDDGAVQVRDDG